MNRKFALLFFLIFLLSCNTKPPIIIPFPGGVIIIFPIPEFEEAPRSVFSFSADSLYNKYEDKIDSLNYLVKAWNDYSVEVTPKGHYIVKIYNNDLRSIIAKATFQDKELFYKTGKVIEWADNGNIIYEGFYQNNMKVHEWKYYDIYNGTLKSEGKYFNGKMKGLWKEYNKLGEVVKEENYSSKYDKFINTFENNVFYEKRIKIDTSVNQYTTLINCNLYDEPRVRGNCTKQEFLSWIRKLRVELIEKEIFGTMRAIGIIKVDKNGESDLKFIRSVNNEAKETIYREFKKINFKFNPPKNSINSQANEFIIRI